MNTNVLMLVIVSTVVSSSHQESLPHTQCKRTYEKVGGFIEEYDRVMPELLLNDRDPNSDKNDGHVLKWEEFEESVHSLACRCAVKAKEKGYKVFGLQFFGECWSGPTAEAKYAKYGLAEASKIFQISGNPPPPCDKSNEQECVGGPLVNYVYKLKEDEQSIGVDGGYSKWSDWTSCSKSCGGGIKGRERTCTNPKPEGAGKDCSALGPAEQTAKCAEQACPDPDVDGNWSPWKPWTACSATCGGGFRVRGRLCNNPAPQGKGKHCVGAAEESEACALEPCPVPCVKALDIGIILDSSGSVRAHNFRTALTFIQDLIKHFKVSPQGTHFGFITYSGSAKLQFRMSDSRYYDFNSITARIKATRYTGGWTRTDRALEMASDQLFTPAGGDRSDKENILIVFTDGKTNRGSKSYTQVLRPLQAKHVRTVAVGIGYGINNAELRQIAMGDQNYVVRVNRFSDLKDKLQVILDDSCQGKSPPTPEPECTVQGKALGMESGAIPDASLSVSSVWDANHGANRGRLNMKAAGSKRGAWSARHNDKGQYFQVDFGKAVKITRIGTQGRQDYSQWITKYWLSYSQDDGIYDTYTYNALKEKQIFEGNKDRNTVVENKLEIPIFARYLRLHPESWYGHISGRFEFYGCTKGFSPPVIPACMSALGLQCGEIPDSKMTASSEWNSGHRAANGRLYFQSGGGRTGAWSAKSNDAKQWLQVDFGKIAKIQKVATQGRQDANQWLTSFRLTYSRNGFFWEKNKAYGANSDRHSVVVNSINPPIYARYVRIHPVTYYGHMSVRAEFYGCTSGFQVPPETCVSALGMQNRAIPDSRITASSMWDANHSPSRARLGTARVGHQTGAWSAKTNDAGQWIQVNFGKYAKVTRISTQGRQDYNQWVNTYTLQYSQDGGHFEDYKGGKILVGNKDRNTIVGNTLDPPIIARYIRIRPRSWYGHISMRFELYGCTEGFPIPPLPACLKPLGVESGKILNSQMSASSVWDTNHGAENGRLHFQKNGRKTGGWSALRNNVHQWLGVDFGKVAKVTRVSTQGRHDYNQWVTSYTLGYSLDGAVFHAYEVRGRVKIFGGNRDRHTVVSHLLENAIFARYIQLHPRTWHRHISMRLEYYGCTSGFVPPSVPKCTSPLGLQSNLVTDSQMSASSEWNSGHRAANARLHFHRGRGRTGGWSSKYNNADQWLQVDFKKNVKVTALGTQGREDYNQWVKSYSLSYSRDGIFWEKYEQVGKVWLFQGNTDRYTVVRHQLEKPFVARYVRILPKRWHGHISMRAEIYGCREGFTVPPSPCTSALGMQNGAIPNSRISASSMWDAYHSPSRARLGISRSGHQIGAWSARANDAGQWLQIDLGKVTKVTRIATQGRQDASQWVRTYILQYSTNGVQFSNYGLLVGNKDRNTISGHILEPVIIARYIRIRPKSWYRHISMRIEVYGCSNGIQQPTLPPCMQPLPMRDDQMSASTIWHSSHGAANGRLNFHAGRGRTGAWSSRYNNKFQFLQVDFGKNVEIRRVATQGRQDARQWVKTYTLSFSSDGIFWKHYSKRGSVVLFKGNSDRYTVVGHDLEPAITTRYIRLRPQTWYRHISMRLQYYGCKATQVIPEACSKPLGMKSKAIPDSRITASSMWDANHSPSRARLGTTKVGHKRGAWSAKTNDVGQWIQVDLGKVAKVTRVATQGRQDYNQWVRSYAVQYSEDGGYFKNYENGQLFNGNSDRNSIVGNVFEPAIIARYIRIRPKSWYGHISMRFELYGCTKGFIVPVGPTCESKLSSKASQLSASSEWDRNHGATNAMLHHQAGGGKTGAWSSRHNDLNQWLQVDLGQISKVTRVSTQGRSDHNQWIKTYTIEYSVTGSAYLPYKVGGVEKVLTGNVDRYTVNSHKLANPIIARFIRFRPKSWYGHISMRVAVYGCTSGFPSIPAPTCGLALGLQSNVISDSQMSASSEWNSGHRAANARLHFHAGSGRTGAWSSKSNNADQWLQVDFRKIAKITKVATQGRQDANQWVKSYTLSYSRDGVFWKEYREVLTGNSDRGAVVSHDLKRVIYARFLRINPRTWYGHISMRAEIYGCTSGFQVPTETCVSALGMQSRAIPDSHITASSMWDGNHSPSRARLGTTKVGHKRGAWSSKTNDAGQWIQIDLGKVAKVTRIATQGRQDYNQWVRSYTLQYSKDGGHFENYKGGQMLVGNKDRNSIVGNILDPAIIGRYIRIRPKSWYGHISMRFELYGCTKGFNVPVGPTCESKLSSRASQLSASSEWDRNHGATNAMLHHQAGGGKTGAWSSRHNDLNQWLQVDLGQISKVTRVSTQGRSDHSQWIKTYTIEYSVTGSAYLPYKVGGVEKVFTGNVDRHTVNSHKLANPIIARFIRFRPKSWYGHISMRVAVYGCTSGFPSIPAPTCGLALGLQSNVISDSQMSASSEWNSGHRAANARLHFHAGSGRTGAWSSKSNNADQWLQVDFRKIAKITKVATQGRQDANQWVKSYTLSYSRDGVFWKEYREVLTGNSDRGAVVSHDLKRVIYARFLRINPRTWYGHISMRAEIYGCTSGFQVPTETCVSALGMQSRAIPDSHITASSMWDGNHSPSRARLGTTKVGHKRGAWSSKTNDAGQWIQIDLGKVAKVTRIATQGRQDYNQWVRSYTLQYSKDGGHFENYKGGQMLVGNKDRNSIVGNILDPAIIGRYIRIRPKSWYGHISMRFELYGCTKGFNVPVGPTCESKLSSRASQLSASSEWDRNHGATNAMLHHQAGGGKTGAWSSRHNDLNQWLQVDLGQISKVTRVSTQGRSDHSQWIKTYTIEYSVTGSAYLPYKVGGVEKVFTGNVDRHTVNSHKLANPIIARFIRFRPKSWYGHISMRVAVYGCTSGFPSIPAPTCGLALGLQSNVISDSQMSASSEWNSGHRAANARLHFHAGSGRTGAWSSKSNNADQWLQVDFRKIAKITKVATQGRQDANQWVKSYTLSFSRDGVFWKEYREVLTGNSDRGAVVSHDLKRVIYARFLRINPRTWYGHISMRAEIYGCTSGFQVPTETCVSALGMQSRAIPDSHITASSMWDGNHSPSRARLGTTKVGHKRGAWSSKTNDAGQWIQIDLGKVAKVTRIATQGRQDYNQWVRSYTLQYSKDGGHFENYKGGQMLVGNKDRNSIVGNILDPAIIGRYIRIRPKSWYGHISMRFELYGCTKGFPIPPISCCAEAINLGDWMLLSSSDWNYQHRAANGKLEFRGGGGRTGAWSARYNNVNQWLLVDFDREMKITRISTQGRHDYSQWVKTYTVEYSQNGVTFSPYKVKGITKVFIANNDRYSIVSHKLLTPIVAQYVRIRPKTWHGHVSMRVGMYGCPTGKKPASPPCHQAMDVGIIMDRSGSIGADNFRKSQDFVARLISHFEYASSGTRFGIIAYNSGANVIFKFNEAAVQNRKTLMNRVYGIRYLKGGTRTDRALTLANTDLFSSRGGYRGNVPNVLFVMTDGKTNRGSVAYPTVIGPLLAKKVKIIAVGVGNGINTSELRQISSKHVFHVKDFAVLSKKLKDILDASCPSK